MCSDSPKHIVYIVKFMDAVDLDTGEWSHLTNIEMIFAITLLGLCSEIASSRKLFGPNKSELDLLRALLVVPLAPSPPS